MQTAGLNIINSAANLKSVGDPLMSANYVLPFFEDDDTRCTSFLLDAVSYGILTGLAGDTFGVAYNASGALVYPSRVGCRAIRCGSPSRPSFAPYNALYPRPSPHACPAVTATRQVTAQPSMPPSLSLTPLDMGGIFVVCTSSRPATSPPPSLFCPALTPCPVLQTPSSSACPWWCCWSSSWWAGSRRVLQCKLTHCGPTSPTRPGLTNPHYTCPLFRTSPFGLYARLYRPPLQPPVATLADEDPPSEWDDYVMQPSEMNRAPEEIKVTEAEPPAEAKGGFLGLEALPGVSTLASGANTIATGTSSLVGSVMGTSAAIGPGPGPGPVANPPTFVAPKPQEGDPMVGFMRPRGTYTPERINKDTAGNNIIKPADLSAF